MRGSGKTTLVSKLVEQLNSIGYASEAWKAQRSDSASPFEGMKASIAEFDQDPFKIFVLDRFHLTEYVMSTYLQRVSLQDLLTTTTILDSMLAKRHAKCVILDATYNTIDERMSLREGHRKLDMPVLNAKNLWVEAKAISRIATVRNNDTPLNFEENLRFCVELVQTEMANLEVRF